MTRNLLVACFAAGALGLVSPLPGQEETPQPIQVTTTQRVNFAPGGAIHFDGSYGYLHIEGWDAPEVEVTVATSGKGYYKSREREKIKALLEAAHVSVDRKSDGELIISTPKRNGAMVLDYDIRVPANSRIVIHHNSSYISVAKVSGDIEATSRGGDILVLLPGESVPSVDAKARFGTITSDFADSSRRRYLLGQQFHHAPAPPAQRIYLRMGFGNIAIKSFTPALVGP